MHSTCSAYSAIIMRKCNNMLYYNDFQMKKKSLHVLLVVSTHFKTNLVYLNDTIRYKILRYTIHFTIQQLCLQVFQNPLILIHDKKISDINSIIRALELAVKVSLVTNKQPIKKANVKRTGMVTKINMYISI
jgi:hypothetical protein